jgi:hypothetical protein
MAQSSLATPSFLTPPTSFGVFFRDHQRDPDYGYVLTDFFTRPTGLSLDWRPVGYPCILLDDWKGTAYTEILNGPLLPTILVYKGMRGVVHQVNAAGTYLYINLIADDVVNGVVSGWVPANFVKIGTDRRFGDERQVKHAIGIVTRIQARTINTFSTAGSGKTVSLLTRLLERLVHLQPELVFVKASTFELIRAYPSPRELANTIAGWIRRDNPGLLPLLDGTLPFNYRDLRRVCRNVRDSDDRKELIYARFYSHWDEQPDKLAQIYVGSTNDIRRRTRVHDTEASKPGQVNFHYRTAYGVTNTFTCVLCILDNPDLRWIVENIFMLIFETYAVFVKEADVSNLDFSSVTDVELATALDQGEQGEASLEGLPAASEAGSANTTGAY